LKGILFVFISLKTLNGATLGDPTSPNMVFSVSAKISTASFL
jgi:hypothetical protein